VRSDDGGTRSATASLPWFARAARASSRWVGHPWAFLGACLFVVAWAAAGPLFAFSDTWQLVINTSTTILTFLMIFLVQNSQNRESEAVQLKLDELIRAVEGARDWMVGVDLLSDEERQQLQDRFAELADRAREEIARRGRRLSAREGEP
jgi:low affinity Fe/Cu permease